MKSMKSTRKVIITILILVFACMFFVACNDNGNPNGNGQQVFRKPWAQRDPNNEEDLPIKVDYSDTEFEGKKINLMLTNSESLNNLFYDYTPEDFGSDRFCSVVDKFPKKLEKLRNQTKTGKRFDMNDVTTANPKTYTRTLELGLVNQGRKSAFDCIEYLYTKEYVLLAEPDAKPKFSWFATTSNDPYTSNQWGLEKIQAYDAWDIEKGSSTLTVGNIDSGIKQTHEDLMGNMSDLSCGTDPYTDSVNHGTITAGIIGAVGNNGKGISGVCWDVKIASLKACIGAADEDPQLVIAAIEYAKANNIKLLNFSGGFYQNKITVYSKELKDAISSYNGLIVVAAGNENLEIVDENSDGEKLYPQSFNLDNVIVVGASNENDERWVGNQLEASNYSSTVVDIFAPGERIYSTSAVSATGYGYATGTSLAAPFVTGVAALILSKYPTLSAAEVKKYILDNVDAVSSLAGKCVTGGRLNAKKAVKAAHVHNKSTCNYTNLGVKRGHTIECRYCNYTETDVHTWSPVKIPRTETVKYYICVFCGAITDIIAIPHPVAVFKEQVLAMIEEKESLTSGDYEFEITKDIVLVKKGGKYWLWVACDENGNTLADLSKVLKKEETI